MLTIAPAGRVATCTDWTGAGACPVDADADVAAEANTDGLGGVTATAGGGAGLAGGNEGSGPTGSIRTTGGTVPA